MKNIIFITGPVRSGKSDFALSKAKSLGKKICFIATCPVKTDLEMKQRIKKHKKVRPGHWKTVEEEINLIKAIKEAGLKSDVVIIDCLTLWVSNLLYLGKTETEIINIAKRTLKALTSCKASVICVSNEVGWGIVPDNKLARVFRDIVGRTNKLFAGRSGQAYLVTSGIPLKLK